MKLNTSKEEGVSVQGESALYPKSLDVSMVENQGKKEEELLSHEKMAELLHDEPGIENKLVVQKPSTTMEEDKKVADKEFIINSKRSHRSPETNGSPNIHPEHHEDSYKNDPSIKSSQRGKDATTITLGKAKSFASDKGKNKITEEIVAKGKKLTLQVKEGGKVEKGTKIELNAAGYPESTRRAFDGVTYFGTNETTALSREIKNDYVFPAEESGFGQKQFKIFYSVDEDQYYLKDLGDGSGTFVRVDSKIVVKQGYIVTFGNYHIVLNYKLSREPDPDHTIYIQLIDGTQAKEQYEFTRKNTPIVVGRGETATIRIKSHALSRVQCRIEHLDGKWYLSDGDGVKKSTNGTWLYAEDPFPIHDGMVFKAGLVLFKAYVHC